MSLMIILAKVNVSSSRLIDEYGRFFVTYLLGDPCCSKPMKKSARGSQLFMCLQICSKYKLDFNSISYAQTLIHYSNIFHFFFGTFTVSAKDFDHHERLYLRSKGKWVWSNKFRLEIRSVYLWCKFYHYAFVLYKPKEIILVVQNVLKVTTMVDVRRWKWMRPLAFPAIFS